MNELWKDIKGYEGLYKVSNYGRVKSMSRYRKGINNKLVLLKDKILKSNDDCSKGYLVVSLSKENKHKNYKIHRLVAETFIPNPNNYPQVNHIDGDKHNNNINNLEWCSCKQNIKHAWENGLNYVSEKHKKVASEIQKERWKKYRENKKRKED